MANVKFTRTQEKQYSGWITLPRVGTQVTGTVLKTTKEKPWVLAAPDGNRIVSASELSASYLFKTDKGTEPINANTVKEKYVDGSIGWTQVVRNTANVPSVLARHIPGKNNGGLGMFEVYPEQFGPTYTVKIPGNIFVRMYTLHGGLKNIATPEQANSTIPKPTKELVTPVTKAKPVAAPTSVAPTKSDLSSAKSILMAQLEGASNNLKKIAGTVVKVSAIKEDADVKGNKYILGELTFTFPVATGKKGTLVTPVAVVENETDKAAYNTLPKNESFGIKPSGKKKSALNTLAVDLSEQLKNMAVSMQNGAKATATNVPVTATYDAKQVEAVVKTACDALKEKVAPMQYTVSNGIFEIVTTDGSMGTVTCIVKQGNAYSCEFVVRRNDDTCAAAKAVKTGLIPANPTVANLKSLASSIVTGFAKIKRQGSMPVTAPVKEAKYEFNLIGKGKSPVNGEVLYVLERITTGAKTTMNRPQLIKLLEEKRVENAWVRWYKNDRQIRLRSKGGLADVDVTGLRRSAMKRTEGAKTEVTVIYSEVIKHLAKKGFTAEGDIEISEKPKVYGMFNVKSEGGSVITAMFSPTEWKYGALAGDTVKLQGIVPEDKRRRSMLASSLVSLIVTAAKNAVVSMSNPDAPILNATDDDFSDPDVETGEFKESDEIIDASDAFAGLEDADDTASEVTLSVPEEEVLDAADAFAGLEDADTPDSAVVSATPDMTTQKEDARLGKVNEILNNITIASAGVNTRVTNTLKNSKLTSSECIEVGNAVMEMKKVFDNEVAELNKLVATTPYLSEFEEAIATATERSELITVAVNKLGAKLQEIQQQEVKVAEEARIAEEQRQAQEENERKIAEAKLEQQRIAAEEEAERLAEEAEMHTASPDEEDPFAGLGDDIDSIFRNLPGEIVSQGN